MAQEPEVPWVIQGEQGPSTLTKWEGDEPVGYEPWCGTCGWHGLVRRFADHQDSVAWTLACDEGAEHMNASGHTYEEEG